MDVVSGVLASIKRGHGEKVGGIPRLDGSLTTGIHFRQKARIDGAEARGRGFIILFFPLLEPAGGGGPQSLLVRAS